MSFLFDRKLMEGPDVAHNSTIGMAVCKIPVRYGTGTNVTRGKRSDSRLI
jgi:hypothetical protein